MSGNAMHVCVRSHKHHKEEKEKMYVRVVNIDMKGQIYFNLDVYRCSRKKRRREEGRVQQEDSGETWYGWVSRVDSVWRGMCVVGVSEGGTCFPFASPFLPSHLSVITF